MLARLRLPRFVSILLALTTVAALTVGSTSTAGAARAAQPNVVVIMVDDMNMYALQYLSNVRTLIAEPGTTFDNSLVSYSLCCPSRATFMTGQYAHNHGVLSNGLPDGGYQKLPAAETLPVWLGRAGYDTGHIGKFLNGYGRQNPTEIPPGWAEWYGSVDPSTYRMWGYTLNENGVLRTYGSPEVEDPALYQTDVYAAKAVDYIQRKAPADKPFFLSFAPLAPHGEIAAGQDLSKRNPRPAPRHLGALDEVTLPKPPSFNEADVSDKPAAVRNRARIPAEAQQRMQNVTLKGRLESLLSVDEAVADIVAALRESGELDNTLIVFTSDNGWMQGEHRIRNGKIVPYEESIRVPLIMRGPGLPAGRHVKTIAANVDLAPTILDAAGATPAITQDGRSLLPIAADTATTPRAVVIENGPKTDGTDWYVGLRAPRWKYIEHSTGEQELYDLQQDPYELTSVHADPRYAGTRQALADRLANLRTCTGTACHQWTPVAGPKP
ncbi:sulfatase [Nonomuraea purpurea]|uniref:Sulfatase n=1 Tax=Nonomuraea purpurea TaxID=1849276 RepID=A0ABV8GJG6_9ACTN